MSESSYFVSHEGQQSGPWGLSAIVDKVKGNELSLTDYIYDDGKKDWVLLLEYPPLAEKLKGHKPKAPPQPLHEPAAKEPTPSQNAPEEFMATEWFVLKGENKFGPFAFTDMIKMLQDKIVYEFDFAWHPGMDTWKRIAELPAFHEANVKKLKSTLMPEISSVFFRRRHRRVKYGGTILIHDNSSVWKGRGLEISAGGAGVIMENSMIVPGQVLYLHFKPCDGLPAFNAICEVVSKKYEDGVKDKNAPIRYGLKFKSISTEAQKFLQEFSKSLKAAA